jgi:hypothetical protein
MMLSVARSTNGLKVAYNENRASSQNKRACQFCMHTGRQIQDTTGYIMILCPVSCSVSGIMLRGRQQRYLELLGKAASLS